MSSHLPMVGTLTAQATIIILKTDKQILLLAINLDIDAMPTTA